MEINYNLRDLTKYYIVTKKTKGKILYYPKYRIMGKELDNYVDFLTLQDAENKQQSLSIRSKGKFKIEPISTYFVNNFYITTSTDYKTKKITYTVNNSIVLISDIKNYKIKVVSIEQALINLKEKFPKDIQSIQDTITDYSARLVELRKNLQTMTDSNELQEAIKNGVGPYLTSEDKVIGILFGPTNTNTTVNKEVDNAPF